MGHGSRLVTKVFSQSRVNEKTVDACHPRAWEENLPSTPLANSRTERWIKSLASRAAINHLRCLYLARSNQGGSGFHLRDTKHRLGGEFSKEVGFIENFYQTTEEFVGLSSKQNI